MSKMGDPIFPHVKMIKKGPKWKSFSRAALRRKKLVVSGNCWRIITRKVEGVNSERRLQPKMQERDKKLVNFMVEPEVP